MPNDYFQFKQFIIRQENCAMKVGTDGVLLGAWVDIGNAERILDVGTGTGLIAIMVAQRSNACVDAIEIEENSFLQAWENIQNCKWKDKLRLFHTSLQEYSSNYDQKYDLIISNPPYFNNSLRAAGKERSLARHTDALSYSDLIKCSSQLMGNKARLAVIIPVAQSELFLETAELTGLFCSMFTYVKPTETKIPVRLLLEFTKEQVPCPKNELVIEQSNRHCYTSQYINLTKEFYLKF